MLAAGMAALPGRLARQKSSRLRLQLFRSGQFALVGVKDREFSSRLALISAVSENHVLT